MEPKIHWKILPETVKQHREGGWRGEVEFNLYS